MALQLSNRTEASSSAAAVASRMLPHEIDSSPPAVSVPTGGGSSSSGAGARCAVLLLLTPADAAVSDLRRSRDTRKASTPAGREARRASCSRDVASAARTTLFTDETSCSLRARSSERRSDMMDFSAAVMRAVAGRISRAARHARRGRFKAFAFTHSSMAQLRLYGCGCRALRHYAVELSLARPASHWWDGAKRNKRATAQDSDFTSLAPLCWRAWRYEALSRAAAAATPRAPAAYSSPRDGRGASGPPPRPVLCDQRGALPVVELRAQVARRRETLHPVGDTAEEAAGGSCTVRRGRYAATGGSWRVPPCCCCCCCCCCRLTAAARAFTAFVGGATRVLGLAASHASRAPASSRCRLGRAGGASARARRRRVRARGRPPSHARGWARAGRA